MLSGEVGYFKGTMQLTHPAFLVLGTPSGKIAGTRSLKAIAEAVRDVRRRTLLAVFERDFFPIYPANSEGAELGHLRVCASGARRAGSDRGDPAGIAFCANTI